MRQCPEFDALITISEALEWNAMGRIRHIAGCSDCRECIDVLEQTHAALTEAEPVDELVIAGIAARFARTTSGSRQSAAVPRWAGALELTLAAVTAPILVTASGFAVPGAAAGAITAAAGAALLLVGRRLAGSML